MFPGGAARVLADYMFGIGQGHLNVKVWIGPVVKKKYKSNLVHMESFWINSDH